MARSKSRSRSRSKSRRTRSYGRKRCPAGYHKSSTGKSCIKHRKSTNKRLARGYHQNVYRTGPCAGRGEQACGSDPNCQWTRGQSKNYCKSKSHAKSADIYQGPIGPYGGKRKSKSKNKSRGKSRAVRSRKRSYRKRH